MDLLNSDFEEYGSGFNKHILEQWKTCVAMANNISERRLTSNNIFIAINAAIIALTSFAPDHKSIVMSIVGIVARGCGQKVGQVLGN